MAEEQEKARGLVPEIEALLVELLGDHPEIAEVRSCLTPESDPAQPSRVHVRFGSGAESTTLVHHVSRRGRASVPWVLPGEVL